MVVLDTCAIIEACKETPSFSKKVVKKIEAGALLLSISFAEIACKIKLGKLEIGISPYRLYEEYKKIDSMRIIDIGVTEWLDSIALHWPVNKDPVDRMVTAFAEKNNLPIVTSDRRIQQFYKNVIW